MKVNVRYFVGFILLLMVEVFIAVYVHDQLIRPFIGDMLVVILLYMLIRSFWGGGKRWLPAGIFAFSVMVELSQLFRVSHYLGFENNRFLRVLCGSVFDWHDILCYAIGCLLIFVFEKVKDKKRA